MLFEREANGNGKYRRFYPGRIHYSRLSIRCAFFFHLSFVRISRSHSLPQSFSASLAFSLSLSLLFYSPVLLPASRFSLCRSTPRLSLCIHPHLSSFSLFLSLNNNNWIWIRKITLYCRQQLITMYIIYTGNRVVCLFHTILLYFPVI